MGVAVVAGALLLTACSTATSPSDTVSQPPAEDLTDPSAASDQLAQAATAECNRIVAPMGKTVKIATTVAPITSIVAMIVGDNGPARIRTPSSPRRAWPSRSPPQMWCS